MMHLRRSLLALVLALSVFAPTSAGGSRTAGHVRAHTTKAGTTVAAHERKTAEKHATAPKAEKPKQQMKTCPLVGILTT
jgi:hypothetical protein